MYISSGDFGLRMNWELKSDSGKDYLTFQFFLPASQPSLVLFRHFMRMCS